MRCKVGVARWIIRRKDLTGFNRSALKYEAIDTIVEMGNNYRIIPRNTLGGFHMSSWIHLITFLLHVLMCTNVESQSKHTELIRVSECFRSPGIPKVSFQCGDGHMIQIVRAFHGLRPASLAPNGHDDLARDSRNSTNTARCHRSTLSQDSNPHREECSYCEGDCADESINEVYDWSMCIGAGSCVKTVMQSYMHACTGLDKFSQYLQVEYRCIPRESVMNICDSIQLKTNEEQGWAQLSSPNYPARYPASKDCVCQVTSVNSESNIYLSIYDLFLETKDSRCESDWIMVRHGDQKHRHCGVIMSGVKNISIPGPSVSLHFHSDDGYKAGNDAMESSAFSPSLVSVSSHRPFKGFWMMISADSGTNLDVKCHELPSSGTEWKDVNDSDGTRKSDSVEEVVKSTASLEHAKESNRSDTNNEQAADQPKDETSNSKIVTEANLISGSGVTSYGSVHRFILFSLMLAIMF